jgi:hypothetical protein
MSAAQDLDARFRAFLARPGFPCVGAKSALGRGQMECLIARSITSAWDDLVIAERLIAFARRWRQRPRLFTSFAVLFEGPRTLSEGRFEAALWARVQSLSDKDRWLGQPWDGRVSPDPDNPHFSLSFGGEGFFVVGLHPHASRRARRFEAPVMVFNLHDQFETLRAQGRYDKLRHAILERDRASSGSINPMLARHGDTSAARQYSGRQVDRDWRCPFRYGGLHATDPAPDGHGL